MMTVWSGSLWAFRKRCTQGRRKMKSSRGATRCRGGYRIYEGGGGGGGGGGAPYIKRCGRQCIEALISLCEARKKFSPSFFTSQDGLSWHLCALHCKFQIRGLQVPWPRTAMSFFLAQISLTNVIPYGA